MVPSIKTPRRSNGRKPSPPSINENLYAMVTIIGIETRKTAEGSEFNVIRLQGRVEVVVSKETGRPYLTARTTTIPCTFDEVLGKSLIGHTLPGDIEKIAVEPYEFKVPGTNKKLKLNHSYRYSTEPVTVAEVIG